jgi:DNA-binding Lrp family transcriptional regulator
MRENISDLLDDLDYRILARLQEDGRVSNSRLAEEVGLTETPCWRRVRRLENERWILGYRAELDRKRLGFGVVAFVEIKFSTHDLESSKAFESAVQDLDRVLTCYNVTGDEDYVLQVIAKDLDDYGRFTRVLRNLPGVTAIRSSLSLREVKVTHSVPLPPEDLA